jgi:hypothetical protein
VKARYRTPNHQDHKRNTSRYININTLNIQNKERILKAAKQKGQVTNSKHKKVMERHISGPERK